MPKPRLAAVLLFVFVLAMAAVANAASIPGEPGWFTTMAQSRTMH
jgi:hypothetical protein